MKIKKMPSEYCHGITLIKMGTDQNNRGSPYREFLLINEDPLEVKGPFYDHLDQIDRATASSKLDGLALETLWREGMDHKA